MINQTKFCKKSTKNILRFLSLLAVIILLWTSLVSCMSNDTDSSVKQSKDKTSSSTKDTDSRQPGGSGSSGGSNSNTGNTGGNTGNTFNNGNPSESVTHEYTILDCDPFVDGRAWVQYYEEETYQRVEYYGFIDMQGKVWYSTERAGTETYKVVYNIGKGSGIVRSDSGIVLIDENGDVKMQLDGTVEVKASGEGYAWIYQNKSTITSLEHLYGIVDYTGQWIKPLENLQEEGVYDKIRYVGGGFVGATGRYSTSYPIYNADESIEITLNGIVTDWHIQFLNGLAFVPDEFRFNPFSITVTKTGDNGSSSTKTYENIQGACIIYTDGRVVELDSEVAQLNYNWAFYDGKVLTTNGGQYYSITDYTKATPTPIAFTAYPASMIQDMTFNGEYGLVQIKGLDNEIYVTLIDVQGNELIQPVKGKHLYECTLAPEGYIYYQEDNVLHIMDKNGNRSATDIVNWNAFFDGNIGVIRDWLDYGLYYIQPNGAKLFEVLKMK